MYLFNFSVCFQYYSKRRALEHISLLCCHCRYNLKTWVQGAAHCAEFATEGAEIDLDKANECRRCYAKIGDWGTEAGFAQGQECLNTYEPSFTELCGEKMTAFQVEFVNVGIGIDIRYTTFGECIWQFILKQVFGGDEFF